MKITNRTSQFSINFLWKRRVFIPSPESCLYVSYFYFGIVGTLLSFLIFQLIRFIGRKIYKKEVMGKGDSKFIAMLGLWLGPLGVILTIAISYISAAIVILIGLVLNKIKLKQTIPFGPFISLGGMLVWIFGNNFFLIRLLS